MATHSSILAWKVAWTKEPGRLQSMGLQSRTLLSMHACVCAHVHTHTHIHTHMVVLLLAVSRKDKRVAGRRTWTSLLPFLQWPWMPEIQKQLTSTSLSQFSKSLILLIELFHQSLLSTWDCKISQGWESKQKRVKWSGKLKLITALIHIGGKNEYLRDEIPFNWKWLWFP